MGPAGPLQEADLIFPTAHTSIHKTLGELKRNNLTIKNRLRSILQDAEFVRQNKTFGLPLVANERCGSWYIDPADKAGSAYFKSTDGHFGEWSFSLRRLNLQLLEIICRSNGCVVVDSTRRGKSMPDAMSKTVPIWIAVVNILLFPHSLQSHRLQTPPEVVSESEHAQIEAKLGYFAQQARDLGVDVAMAQSRPNHPLRPYWLTPDSTFSDISLAGDFSPVVLCTASSRASSAHACGADYVQGAADDQESWACGLTPGVFWQEKDLIFGTDDDSMPALIRTLMLPAQHAPSRSPTLVMPTTQVFICGNGDVLGRAYAGDTVVSCSEHFDLDLQQAVAKHGARYVHLPCGQGKIGSRQLRHELRKLDDILDDLVKGRHVICCCPTGKDLAVGVALTVLSKYFSDDGSCRAEPHTPSKEGIRRRLVWINLSTQDAAPSRATLQSVNAYLMS